MAEKNYTYNFLGSVRANQQQEYSEVSGSGIFWTLSGFYFEACVLEQLCQIANKESSKKDNKAEFNGSQLNAIKYFEETGSAKSLDYWRGMIQQAGYDVAQQWWSEVKADILKNYKDKNIVIPITVGNVKEQAGTGAANPLGDLEVIFGDAVEGKRVVLELKWQFSHSYPVKWFGLSDGSLFGDTNSYLAYLQTDKSPDKWSGAFSDKIWANNVRTMWLQSFLNDKIAPISPKNSVIAYLLQKGEALKSEKFDAKYVLHGRSAGVEVTKMGDLEALMQDKAQQIGIGSFQSGQNLPRGFADSGQITFIDDMKREVAWFGITNYAANKKKADKATPDTAKYSFNFALYIIQKAFNNEAFN